MHAERISLSGKGGSGSSYRISWASEAGIFSFAPISLAAKEPRALSMMWLLRSESLFRPQSSGFSFCKNGGCWLPSRTRSRSPLRLSVSSPTWFRRKWRRQQARSTKASHSLLKGPAIKRWSAKTAFAPRFSAVQRLCTRNECHLRAGTHT